MGEPLGRSQVLAYLTRLQHAYDLTLISFEKDSSDPPEQLRGSAIEWVPLRYHRRPPVLSTLVDVLAGRRALVRASRARPPAIVHVRSDVPMLMARLDRRLEAKVLFDIRGFWADERVEGGLWSRGGVLYRVAKRCEKSFFASADAIVTLTRASVPVIQAWSQRPEADIEVIPTCVDLERFTVRAPRPDGPHAVWSGSIGTWYRFDLVARVAAALAMPLSVLTRQRELALRELNGYAASVRTVRPEEVSTELCAGDVGLCLIASSFSKRASAPTRFAEYLASGMPVLVTAVGDLERLVEDYGVGVVLREESEQAIAEAAAQLKALAAEPDIASRCRRLAEERFDVEVGARRYAAMYRRLAG